MNLRLLFAATTTSYNLVGYASPALTENAFVLETLDRKLWNHSNILCAWDLAFYSSSSKQLHYEYTTIILIKAGRIVTATMIEGT